MPMRFLALSVIALAACGSIGTPAPSPEPVADPRPAPTIPETPGGPARLDSVERAYGEITDGAIERIGPGRTGGVSIRGELPGAGASGRVVMLLLRFDTGSDAWPGTVLDIDSKLDRAGGTAELRLRNWSTKKVEMLDRWTVGTTSGRHTIDLRGRREHINDDGGIEMYLAYLHADPFVVEIDTVRVRRSAQAAGRAAAPAPPGAPPPARAPASAPARTSAAQRRLLHYQTIGFSSEKKIGRVASFVCSQRDGWSGYIQKTLRPLVQRLGAGSFDWWGHRPGGAWDDIGRVPLTSRMDTRTLFEQMDIARRRFPKLVNYSELAEFARRNRIDLYGYIGMPRCDDVDKFTFTPVPEHADPAHFRRWYGEFIDYGFKGVGHDFSAALPKGSPAISVNFVRLESLGIEVFLESVPWRGSTHLLGYSVVAENRLWENADANPRIFSEAEIRAGGGRTIHLLLHPPAEHATGRRDRAATQKWRFETAKRLLREGKTVAVPLDQLMKAGYPIEELARIARTPAR
ncbi:MAG: hypothetical protein GY715_03390 [Planctomycetes bacterium]|nr:hypothetical protein [Planctomycetota bacterium]